MDYPPPPTAIPTSTTNKRPGEYSDPNITGILPPELRTQDNLQGREIPKANAKELLEKYRQELQSYEEAELEVLKQHQKRGSRPENPKAPDTDDENEYRNPEDALPDHFRNAARGNSVGKGSSPPGERKFTIAKPSGNPEEYTEVFDSLPPDQMQAVVRPVRQKAFSDSSPLPPRKKLFNGYEDLSLNGGSTTGDSDGVPKPNSLPSRSLENLAEGYEHAESKRTSYPASTSRPGSTKQRNMSKEVVRFDPQNKSFRLDGQKRRAGEADNNDEADSGYNNRNSPDSDTATEAAKLKEQEALFEITGEFSPDMYAMVNVADKQQYRTEADVMKSEGSGTPMRYRSGAQASVDTGSTAV